MISNYEEILLVHLTEILCELVSLYSSKEQIYIVQPHCKQVAIFWKVIRLARVKEKCLHMALN